MNTYLIFMMNSVTQDEFVAPVTAATRDEAVKAAYARYPVSVYTVLTCYQDAEMRRILDDVARWPGVASKVQPPLEQLLHQAGQRPHTAAPVPPRNTNNAMQRLAQTITQSHQQSQWQPFAPSFTNTATAVAPASPSARPVVASAPATPPSQQTDLKSALALLRASKATGGSINQSSMAPLPAARPAPVAKAAPKAAPAPQEAMPTQPAAPRSVIDIFKSMRG